MCGPNSGQVMAKYGSNTCGLVVSQRRGDISSALWIDHRMALIVIRCAINIPQKKTLVESDQQRQHLIIHISQQKVDKNEL